MWLIKTLLVFYEFWSIVYSSPFKPDNEKGNITDHNNIHNQLQGSDYEKISTNVTYVKELSNEEEYHWRRKRGLSLVSVVECGAKCSRAYLIWYGNYCGPGGSGTPINSIDSCCQLHDECYDRYTNCGWWKKYFTRQNWDCFGGDPHCYDRRYQYDLCRWQLCECDRIFVQCLNREAKKYDKCY